MPFLGNPPADQYQSLAKQTITGDGSTAYTLNRSVTNAYDMEVFINNTRQEPDTSYTASGNTITFTAAVTSSDSCYIIYQGQSVGSINPPTGSVGTIQIANTSVTHAKLHTDMDLSSKTVRIDAMNMSSSTNKMQMAIQSAVSNRFALRSTHTADYDNNPFIIYQPSSAGVQNDALVIDEGGRVLTPKQPMVRMSLASNFGINNVHPSGPGAQITGFTVHENVGNHWNNSNNNFTCPVAGVYCVSIFWIKYPASGAAHVDLHKNGSAFHNLRWRAPEGTTSYEQAGGTAFITCAANDILDWHYFGSPGIHSGNGQWSIRFVG